MKMGRNSSHGVIPPTFPSSVKAMVSTKKRPSTGRNGTSRCSRTHRMNPRSRASRNPTSSANGARNTEKCDAVRAKKPRLRVASATALVNGSGSGGGGPW